VNAYKNPAVHLLELGLVLAVLFHSINGIKITLIDFFPSLAARIKLVGRTSLLVFILSALVVVAIMGRQIIDQL
jgi:succinate dehydrogenase / fumarate reductase cytochrome b subunit